MGFIKKLFSILLLFHTVSAEAQWDTVNITPRPQNIRCGTGNFVLNEKTRLIATGEALINSVAFLQSYLDRFYGFKLDTAIASSPSSEKIPFIRLAVTPNQYPVDGYTLSANEHSIEITAATDTAIFYGIQSLIGLLPVNKSVLDSKAIKIPTVDINDSPAFRYRGIHLDVARHFFTIEYLKKFIDLLALHKFNKFHWHLTDDQGWRIEIKKYPLLTAVGSCRDQTLKGRFGSDVYDSTRYCGYYTQEEIKDLVSYASKRFITIIPEIDMPGHTTAALASYPFLGCTKGPYEVSQTWGVHKEVMCAGNDSTYSFINEVIGEVAELFPSSLIHIGGDEVPKERWQACAVCQARMKKEGLRNESDLQSYFMNRVQKIVKAHDRTIAGWDEILEGKGVPGAVIMAWRGKKFSDEALRIGHPVIFTPDVPLYLNFQQSANEDSITQGGNNSLEKVYAFEPKYALGIPRHLVLGIQANLWTEYISNPAKLEYMALPRLSAVAEAAWTNSAEKNFTDFEKRLPVLIQRYEQWGFNFSPAHFGLQHEVVALNGGKIGWRLFSRTPGRIFFRESETDPEKEYYIPVPVLATATFTARLEDSTGRPVGHPVSLHLNVSKSTGKEVTLVQTPNPMYGGKGGFTLVDGIQNHLGMVKSAQFLGFLGTDLDATIDLASVQHINSITLHAFEQQASWIYAPGSVKFFTSVDGINFQNVSNQLHKRGIKNLEYSIKVNGKVRFVRILATNHGVIKPGKPGAGRKAWLFADEIVVN